MSIGRDLLNVPMGEMIQQMAFAIADSQLALDESGVQQAELMGGKRVLRDDLGKLIDETGNPSAVPVMVDSRVYFGYRKDNTNYVPELVSMMELGFTPTFYQFIDTVIEVKIAVSITRSSEYEKKMQGTERRFSYRRSGRYSSYQVTTTPVDAKYTSKFSYSAEGSSLLRTKLVPVPPPAVLEERARMLLEQNEADREEMRNDD